MFAQNFIAPSASLIETEGRRFKTCCTKEKKVSSYQCLMGNVATKAYIATSLVTCCSGKIYFGSLSLLTGLFPAYYSLTFHYMSIKNCCPC